MMSELLQALAQADEAYLTGMTNKGIYKRACKDIDGVTLDWTETAQGAEVQIGGETCQINAPLWDSKCSCPSRSVCRHIIGAILWLKAHAAETEALDAETEDPDVEEETPETAASPTLPDVLQQALREVSTASLKKALGSKLRQTVELVLRQEIQLEESSILSGTLPDGTAVRLLYPLEHATCACHKKELCPHKAAVILAWQYGAGCIQPQDILEQAAALPKPEIARIHDCSAKSLSMLEDVLRWGLVRMPDALTGHMEMMAVQCHSLKLAQGERLLRELGARLTEHRTRRAIFQRRAFLARFCTCVQYLERLQTPELTADVMGSFRRSYEEYTGDLELLPIGIKQLVGGNYEGDIYYFLNMDAAAVHPFLSFSDIRPTFYETERKRRNSAVIPWNLELPLKEYMRSKLLLKNAKVSEGNLSSSKETLLVTRTAADLNCERLRQLVYTDFRRLAVDLSEKKPETELDRMVFVHPTACTDASFDKIRQLYRMTLTDAQGCCITVSAKYKAETQAFIRLLEQIADTMQTHPETPYVLLATARLAEGELQLSPIEFYDFIQPPAPDSSWQLPKQYDRAAAQGNYARDLLHLLSETESWLCSILQSGLQAPPSREVGERLSERAERAGMHGFSERIQRCANAVEQFRHSMTDHAADALHGIVQLEAYLTKGREKLEILCVLDTMKGSEHHALHP